jgi:hypothetical protein
MDRQVQLTSIRQNPTDENLYQSLHHEMVVMTTSGLSDFVNTVNYVRRIQSTRNPSTIRMVEYLLRHTWSIHREDKLHGISFERRDNTCIDHLSIRVSDDGQMTINTRRSAPKYPPPNIRDDEAVRKYDHYYTRPWQVTDPWSNQTHEIIHDDPFFATQRVSFQSNQWLLFRAASTLSFSISDSVAIHCLSVILNLSPESQTMILTSEFNRDPLRNIIHENLSCLSTEIVWLVLDHFRPILEPFS